MEVIHKYFPKLSQEKLKQFEGLYDLYLDWNAKINVISRKDIDELYIRHVLHSLAIYKFLPFTDGSKVLDIGTGGGFPGIPLAIMMPEVSFLLTDSIGKKIKVVEEVAAGIELKNVRAQHIRSEQVNEKFDFVVSRAVAELNVLLQWSRGKTSNNQRNALPNGLICLKGGDLKEELKAVKMRKEVYSLTDYFDEPFFETKKLIYVAL